MQRRVLSLPLAASLLGGCFLSTDLSGTPFLCEEDGVCPQGLSCVGGRCVGPGQDDDAGGDGAVDGGGGGDAALPGDFAFRQELVIDNTGRGQLVDFPLLVALDPDRIDYGALREDGADLAFVDADGTPLSHEIELWDPQGRSIVWVRVPTIDTDSAEDSIWMYFGDPQAEVAQDEESVWRSYEEVYHLDDQGDEIDDAAVRNYDGIPTGAAAASGFLGLGHAFSGAGQYIDLGSGRDFARAVPGVTVEAWVHPQQLQPAPAAGVIFGASVTEGTASRVELRLEADRTLSGGARTQDVGDRSTVQTLETIALDDWSWVALVCDFAAGEVTIVVDDHVAQTLPGVLFDPSTPDTSSNRAVIGANEDLLDFFWSGLLDEVRIAPRALPGDWLSAQNASMREELLTYRPAEAL